MIALLATSALASTFADVPTVDTLVRTSPTIVQGVVTVTHTEPCSLGLCTTYTVTVSETWRGSTGDTVRVTLPGGRTGELTQRVAGLPLWSRGDTVLLFLDEGGRPGWTSLFTVSEAPPRPAAARSTIALSELEDPMGRRPLTSVQELRAQVSRAEPIRP